MTSSNSAGNSSASPHTASPDVWQSTRAQTALATQIAPDEDDYLAPDKLDIGRQTSVNERELFVSCAPAEAMQQQFEHLRPEFIAVHDIATTSSRKLLAGIAAASSQPLQKLVIRRQGYGTVLASLEFVELPTAEGSSLRMYSTEAEAETSEREALARMLLAFSRLAVVMVGDLPGRSMASALASLRDQMVSGPWPNRQVLLLPLASASTLVSQGMELGRGTGVNVRTTPQVTRPADAWGFINGTWGRMRGCEPAVRPRSTPVADRPPARSPAPGPGPPATAGAPSAHASRPTIDPLLMRPMPAVPSAASRATTPKGLLDRYVHQLAELAGMVSCCVFDVASGLEIAHAGARPDPADLASHGSTLLAAMVST
ncbi:MAG: hypothetical protein H7337_02955, partial [Rhizobacter sp.]|nr:hypothetical protein [Rhizobacter sp.]